LAATLDTVRADVDAAQRAKGARAQGAIDRARAAADREQAAIDRADAARDLRIARATLARAQIDGLTGAYGREMGERELFREMNRARRTGKPLVLAFVDVDRLKERNDSHGHAAGDALLRGVVTAIRSQLRSYDPIVRLGGDEFVCGLADTGLGSARLRFNEIQADLARAPGGGTISVGLAAFHRSDTLEKLKMRADAALYDAKRSRGHDADSAAESRRFKRPFLAPAGTTRARRD
jgi:diguanylate cyclase (GGDEF)-like protein